jgi:hypothetical protein
MKTTRIVIPTLVALALVGAATARVWQNVWETLRPREPVVVDHAMQVQTIDTLLTQLNAHYVFPEKARRIEAVVRQRQQAGAYDALKDGEQFAKQLTTDLAAVAHDLHMSVEFARRPVPADEAGAPPANQAKWEERTNFLMRLIQRTMAAGRVAKVEHLSNNIGYLQVKGFPPDFLMSEKFGETMDALADTRGLIIDLRDNGGGSPQSVALLVSYFVDQRTRLNDIWERDTGASTQQWTTDKLAGKSYGAQKPVVILAGPGTMSAGEDFAYTMQAMQRATVIGKPTWGGAHPSRPFRLAEHFYAVIPSRRSISPVTHSNWEGVGVTPDIVVAPDQALGLGKDLLQRQLQGKAAQVATAR